MYNLNYTYLTDLEVDTRQTFADLFDDLTLLDKNVTPNNYSFKESATTLISSWQSHFWHSDNSNKDKLNVTFTDISVYHSVPSGDIPGSKEIMTVGELDAIYESLQGQWPNNMTFSDFCNSLINAIDKLQKIMIDDDHSYPINSIVINNKNPSDTFGHSWRKQAPLYLGERRKTVGYQMGSFNTLDETVILPSSQDGKIPAHSHEVKFLPNNGSGSKSQSARESCNCSVWESCGDPGSGYGTKSGYNHINTAQVVHSGGAEANGGCPDASPKTSPNPWSWINVSEGTDPNYAYNIKGIVTSRSGRDLPEDTKYGVKIAPNTFPISNSHVWERIG